MANRIPFSLEDKNRKRQASNWRDPQPGDVCWHIPDPDTEGTIDHRDFRLCLLSNRLAPFPRQFKVLFFDNGGLLYTADAKDLVIASDADDARGLEEYVRG